MKVLIAGGTETSLGVLGLVEFFRVDFFSWLLLEVSQSQMLLLDQI
jgi:hypothetical protein